MVEIVGRGKGAKLAFNSLGIPSPNTRRLHRPQRRSVLANSHRWARPKQVRGLPSTLKFVQPTAGRMIANSHRSTGSDLVRRVDHVIRIWDGSRMPRLDRTPLPLLADRRQTRTGVSDHQANSLQIIAMVACNRPNFGCRICDATKHDQQSERKEEPRFDSSELVMCQLCWSCEFGIRTIARNDQSLITCGQLRFSFRRRDSNRILLRISYA
jgi:hypothetical protein